MFITTKLFSERHEVSINSIQVAKYEGGIPESFFKPIDGSKRGEYLIDEEAILRRKAFRDKVNNACAMLAYYLTEHQTTNSAATEIANHYNMKASTFYGQLSWRLFSVPSDKDSIMLYKVPKSNWYIYKYYRYLLRQIRKTDPTFDFEEYLANA